MERRTPETRPERARHARLPADDSAIAEAIEEWTAAMHAKDLEGVMRHYAEEFRAFNIAPPLQARGKDSWRAALKEWLDSWKGPVDLEMHELETEVDGEVAFTSSVNHVTGTRAADGGKVDIWVRATVGWRKSDGQWLVTHEHVSVPFYMEQGMRAAVDLKP
jgi:ketosteroid isomerase-like protein